MSNNYRSFTIDFSSNGKIGGRYISKTPLSAARKAVSKRLFKNSRSKTVNFQLKETTQGSTHKIYSYTAKSVKLRVPKVIILDGKRIVYRYKNVITPVV